MREAVSIAARSRGRGPRDGRGRDSRGLGAVEVAERRAEHVAVVALALEGEEEGGCGLGPAFCLGLADHAGQNDLDLLVLSERRALQVHAGGADSTHGAEVVERVDRLGAGGLEEELGDLGAALVEGLNTVGQVSPVGVSFPGQRYLKIRLRPATASARGDPGHGPSLYGCQTPPASGCTRCKTYETDGGVQQEQCRARLRTARASGSRELGGAGRCCRWCPTGGGRRWGARCQGQSISS